MRSKQIKKILVTGGAGFIGSFLVDELIKKGYKVRILDNLEDQVHFGKKPKYLNKKAQFIKGDVRNYLTFKNALRGMDAVFHLAAAVGVAQSNYEINKYVGSNIGGTANLLDFLVNGKHQIKKLIVAASNTGLGEGNYNCPKCNIVRPPLREETQLKKNNWEPVCPNCARKLTPKPTTEESVESPNSTYAITKKAQQDMCLMIGKLYDIPTVATRFFNVYGPRQSLSNPYTGVAAIFINRLKNDQLVKVYEDGNQTRDFISVHDVIRALILALESNKANYQILNIGSGRATKIKDIAQILSNHLGKKNLIKISKQYRKNDIRHCFADNNKAQKLLGWKPKVALEEGFKELIKWSEKEKAENSFGKAEKELKTKGLI